METINQYLPLYIGQPCTLTNPRNNATVIDKISGIIIDKANEKVYNVMPELWSLEDMTEEDMKELFDTFMKSAFGYNPCERFEFLCQGNSVGLKAWESENLPNPERWGFTIKSDTGYMWLSCSGRDQIFNHFEATLFLLSRGYWLFGNEAFTNGLVIRRQR